MLHFGMKPPFTFERFIQACEEFIPKNEVALLAALPLIHERPFQGRDSTLDRWFEFDRDIRNELVKIRAARLKVDPFKYLRPDDGYVEPYLTHIALHAHRNPSAMDAEKILDEARWNKLEEIAQGHYFDFDFLIVYALKLLLLWRWENIRLADKDSLLEHALKVKEASVV